MTRRMPHGAAQAVGLLLSVVSSTQLSSRKPLSLDPVSKPCQDCEGPVTYCPACKHYHCDEDGCIPVECAQALEED